MKPNEDIDYASLRAKRNADVQRILQECADELGVPLQSVHSSFDPNACYCACSMGGPCEHVWDGTPWESEDGCAWSRTCSRCGDSTMSHDMRNLV